MDFNNKPINSNLADNTALRAMVIHTKDDNTHQFFPMEEGGKSLEKGLISALQKLKKVNQLPNEQTLFSWSDEDIDAHNAEIAEAIAQYESHVRRDHSSMILLREQNAILAQSAWEQQIYICNLNERYLQIAEENKKLIATEDETILDNMVDITTLMTNLRETLAKRQQKVSEIVSPIDFSKILETIKKLKSALLDINVLNISLVKRNNLLQIELSFMPEEMRERIRGAPFQRENQRKDPHYLIPDGNKFVFQRANPNNPTFPIYTHEVITGLSVTFFRRQMISCVSSIPATRKAMSIKGTITEIKGLMPKVHLSLPDQQRQVRANKRAHDTKVAQGHKVHSSRAQRMSQADNNNQISSTAANMANLPTLQSVVPTARIRKEIRDVAVPSLY
jgi:hypothetical protein